MLTLAILLLAPLQAEAAIKAPANFAARSLSSSAIELTWTDGSTDETGYEIARSLSSKTSTLKTIATTGPNATNYQDAGLLSNTKYYYRARARRNGSKSGWSKVANATTQLNPTVVAPSITGQPVSQTVTAPAAASFNVTATGTPLNYQWERNGVAIPGATGAGYTTPATSAADSGSGYRVLVSNSAGTAASTTATLTVNAAPDTTAPTKPTGLDADAAACDRIDLSWNASTDSGGSGLEGYNIYRDGSFVKEVLAPTTSTTDGGLAASTQYSYTARAVDNAGNMSAESSQRSATTPACPDTTAPSLSVSHGPASPTTNDIVTLTATASDASGIDTIAVVLDGNTVRSCTSSPCTYSSPAPLSAGPHSYRATATDDSASHNAASDPTSGTKSFTVAQTETFNPKLVGSIPGIGTANDVTANGGRASIASGSFGLSEADITNPGAIQVAGVSDRPFSGDHVADGDSRTVVTGVKNGLARMWMLDRSDPDNPHVIGELPSTATSFLDVALNAAGTRAVIALGSAGVRVVDLTNPAAPTSATFDTAGVAFAVAINSAGTLAYVADGSGGLKVLSLANPSAPTQVGNVVISGIQRDIALQGNVAYLADQMGRLVTVDIASPSAPAQLGALVIGRYTFNVAVEGNRVVTRSADSVDYLNVIDTSSPASPVTLGSVAIDAAGGTKGLALSGGRAYVANGAQGLKVYDLTPTLVGSSRDDFVSTQIASSGDRTVVNGTHVPTNTARMRVIDSSDPSHPNVIGELPSTAPSFLDVAINGSGTRAVIALGSAGVRVVDLTNPAAPTSATFDTAGVAFAVAINSAGTLAYVADGSGGLKVLSLATPSAPTQVGNVVISGIQRDIALQGNVAYLADQMGRLVTVDIASPSAPAQLGALVIGRYTFNVAVEGTRVVVHSADSAAYLDVIDVASPNSPVLRGSVAVDAAGAVKGLAISDNRAYVADGVQGLKIYSLADPDAPALLSSGHTVGAANDVTVDGSSAWVADAAATVSAVDLFGP